MSREQGARKRGAPSTEFPDNSIAFAVRIIGPSKRWFASAQFGRPAVFWTRGDAKAFAKRLQEEAKLKAKVVKVSLIILGGAR